MLNLWPKCSREESREESAPLSHAVQLVVDVPDDEGPSESVPQPSAPSGLKWTRPTGETKEGKAKGPGAECVQVAPDVGAGDSHPQAAFDAKCQERESGRMTWADSGEEKQESEEGERETDRACEEGEEVEAQKELKEGDITAAGET